MHMGLWKKSTAAEPERPKQGQAVPPADSRLPGSCGYGGPGAGKNGMPEMRLTFVRPDGTSDR